MPKEIKPNRVLHVFASLNMGGAESMIMSLYRKIDKNNIQFDFVVNDSNEPYHFEEEVESLGGRVFRVPKYIGKNHISYVSVWKKLLKEHPEWNILHCHHTSVAFAFFGLAKKMGMVTIAHSHTSGGDGSLKSFVKRGLRKTLAKKADYLLACSNESAQWMFKSKKDRAFVLKNSLDGNCFKYDKEKRDIIRRKLGLQDEIVLGHVGRFDNNKNQEFVINVFKELRNLNVNAKLLLIGEGEQKALLEEKVKEFELSSQVNFMGVRKDVYELLQAMDVFVFPSYYEGLPVTLIEAQASGLPCFISNTISQEVKVTELIEFLSLDDPAHIWAKHLLSGLINFERKDQSECLVKEGYDVAKNVSWLSHFYLNIIEKQEQLSEK